jgi:hypothetical protein
MATAIDVLPRPFAEDTLALAITAERQSLMEAEIEFEVDSRN